MSRLTAPMMGLALLGLSMAPGEAPAQDGYRLHVGDTLRIEVMEDASLNRAVLIAPDGRISLPLAGGLAAAGRTIEAVQDAVADKLASNFATKPTVYISLERQSQAAIGGAPAGPTPIDVYVVGEAGKPGKLALKPGTTVLQAIAEMGGFTKFAAVKRIQLRRGADRWTIDYKAIVAGTSDAGAMVLSEGDVFVIPQRKLFE